MKKCFIASLLLLCALHGLAQSSNNIVPMPAEVRYGRGSFELSRNTVIVLEGSGMERTVSFFNDYLQNTFGYKLKTAKNSAGANIIRLNYERMDKDLQGAYTLQVDKKGIYIAGDNEEGVFYGMQTLIQLMPPQKDLAVKKTDIRFPIPYLSITDEPRFAYRGMHLDVGRHFFPVAFIKKYIDWLATYKFNTFHWHLTEDQGWRIEIKKYPLLTETGSCRDQTLVGRYGSNKYDGTKYCGYYTQKEIKEIVKYATDRYITVIPEIEMPGHSTAALASYPYLGCTKGPYKVMDTWGVLNDVFCAGSDDTYTFLQNVLDEVIQLFPSKYIHIGGDECPKERWKTCPVCQKKIKDEGLKDEHALQSYFIQRIEKYLNSKGRRIIGWDEILEGGLAPNATVMCWRGEEGGITAAKQNHDVIMTPGSHCYLDHSQSQNEDSITIGGYLPLETVYSYEPVPAVLSAGEAKHILGAQGNMWTEYMKNPSKVEYMLFPRMMALSEVLWSPKEKRSWNDFERRLPVLFERLDQGGTNYSKAYYDLKQTIMPTPDFQGLLWKIESKLKNGYIGYPPVPGSTEVKMYNAPLLITDSGTKEVCNYIYNKPAACISQKFFFNKATGKKIMVSPAPSKNYPGDGAFTLVNGVQNKKGLSKSAEFLGFLTDCEVIIDLGSPHGYNSIILHALTQEGSWIYPPQTFTIFTSKDGVNYKSRGVTNDFVATPGGNGTMKVNFMAVNDRYVKLVIENWGPIFAGKPGAGNPAWMFIDEVEID